MALKKIYFIGTQLLFLSHVAHSFIALTANIEDVKKIARKFVSEALAEKIAEFVVRATNQLVTNLSSESDEYFGNILNSFKDGLNIGRVGNEKTKKDGTYQTQQYIEIEKDEETTTETLVNTGQVINWEKEVNEIAYDKYSEEEKPKSYEKQRDYEQQKPDYDEQKKEYETKEQEQSKLEYEHSKVEYEHEKLDNERQKQNKQLKPDIERQIVNYKQPERDEQPRLDYKKQNLDYKDQNPDYKKYLEHNYKQRKPDNKQKLDYEQQKYDYKQQKLNKQNLYYTQQKPTHNLVHKKPKARKPKLRHQNPIHRPVAAEDLGLGNKPILQTTPKPIDSTILYKALRNGDLPRKGHRLTGFDSGEFKNTISNQTSEVSTLRGFNIQRLTTKKERTEFDQYDNPNYPKAEFIATSGPVALPKVIMKKPWWEKEMVKQS